MSFVKKFSSVLPATKHQSRIVENSYMIQFPDISPPIHGFHSFVLRVENQPYLCYNSSSSHRCTGPQESSKSLGSRAHITLAYDFILMLFFSFFFFLFLFISFRHLVFKQPFWLSNCCSWKVGNVPGKEPARVSKSWAVPWSNSQVGALTNWSFQSISALTILISPQVFPIFQILAMG